MKIDLHSHTFPMSACSNMSVEQLIEAAKQVGLDGICVTEHNKAWEQDEILKLREKFSFLILNAMEVTTKDGDVLVFGFYEEMNDVISARELRLRVNEVGGYTVAAHPFRGFLLFGFSDLSLSPDRAATRPVFQAVDGIEAYNCKVTEQETRLAFDVGARLGLPCLAGSDAHTVADVGKHYTIFTGEIATEDDLVRELRAGRFRTEPMHD